MTLTSELRLLLKRAIDARRRQLLKRGWCAGCRCLYSERTPGCLTCAKRHYGHTPAQRERQRVFQAKKRERQRGARA